MIENPIRLIRELKGAPLSIYMVLGLVGQRVTQEYLERSTGYTDKPVSQALSYLQEIGLADRTRSGWALCRGARQLPLPIDELAAATQPAAGSADNTHEEHDEEQAADDQPGPEPVTAALLTPAEQNNGSPHPKITAGNQITAVSLSRKYSDSLITTTSINSLNLEIISSSNLSEPGRKNSDFGIDTDPEGHSLVAKAEALRACCIASPKQESLAGRVDCAVRVFALENTLKKIKRERYQPGLLIYALEHDQPVSQEAWIQAAGEWQEYCREVENATETE